MNSTPPIVKKRLFVGIPLPEELTSELIALQIINKEVPLTRWVQRQNLHITTFFIGETPVKDIEAIIEHLSEIASQTSPFAMRLKTLRFAPKKKPYMVWAEMEQCEAFSGLLQAISQQLKPEEPVRNNPLPHITLARFKKLKDLTIFNLEKKINHPEIEANKMVLWESLLKQTGAEYIPVREFDFT